MGWRFRKSIGNKWFRVNLGKRGVNSMTVGRRGGPHLTTGNTGTRVGASIPGTGIYYTERINKPGTASQTDTAQFPIAQPVPAQPAMLPPNIPPRQPITPPNDHQLPWSKLVIASAICSIIGLPFSPSRTTASFAQVMATFGLGLGIAGLVVIIRKKSRRSVIAAIGAIVLAMVPGLIATSVLPESTNTATTQPASGSSAALESASAEASADASQSAEAEKQADEVAAELADAKSSLTDKIGEAHTLLDSSNNNVADPQTRVTLTDAINIASAVSSDDPNAYRDAVTPLQQAMDSVTASIAQKKNDDAAAAKKVQEQKAAADAAAAKRAADNATAAKRAQKQAQDQQKSHKSQQSQQQRSVGTAHGGAFCSPEGARAKSDRSSNILTCRVASDGRLRWKK